MRGHVRRRRTWEFIIDVGPHPVTGKRRQKSKSGFATKKEAESALREFIRYVEGGGDPCPERITLAAHLTRWLDYQRARGIRSRTLEAYEGYFRREIVPIIGGLEIAKLRPGHIRAVLAGMQRRGLSAATITQARSALGSALRQAVEDGLIPASPVAAVKRPKMRRPELHCPTPAQLAAVIAASRDTSGRSRYCWLPLRGHVAPEVLGISWEDVDFAAGTVSIRRGLQRVSRAQQGVSATFTPLKTKRAIRTVALPAFALDRLRRHRREQLERRSALGSAWRDPVDSHGEPVPLVCTRKDGYFLYPDAFTKAFKRSARKAGLHPSTRLHDVRHAVATELGRRGVQTVIVSAVLGHASPAFTIAVYQHAWQEGPHEAAVALQAALAPPPKGGTSHVGNPLARTDFARENEELSVAN